MFLDHRPTVRVDKHNEVRWHNDTLTAMIQCGRFYLMDDRVVLVQPVENGENLVTVTPLETRVTMRSWLNHHIRFIRRTPSRNGFVDEECVAPSSLASELANRHTFRGDMKGVVFEGCEFNRQKLYSCSKNAEGYLVLTASANKEEKEAA